MYRFRVHAPLEAVVRFHRQSSSLIAITPPPVVMHIHHAPEYLNEGDEIDFTLRIGPLPIRWQARIEAISPIGFTDRQLTGPFADWVHRHRFVLVTVDETEVIDEVNIRLRWHPLWGPVGLFLILGLPLLFAYRSRKTRRLLERPSSIIVEGFQRWKQ